MLMQLPKLDMIMTNHITWRLNVKGSRSLEAQVPTPPTLTEL